MNKGFAGAVLLLAAIVAMAILLSTNNTAVANYSFKEMIPQAKSTLSNYEVALNQAATDCKTTAAQLAECVDANTTTVLATDSDNPVKCTKLNVSALDLNTVLVDLNCSLYQKKDNEYLQIFLRKTLTVTKRN